MHLCAWLGRTQRSTAPVMATDVASPVEEGHKAHCHTASRTGTDRSAKPHPTRW